MLSLSLDKNGNDILHGSLVKHGFGANIHFFILMQKSYHYNNQNSCLLYIRPKLLLSSLNNQVKAILNESAINSERKNKLYFKKHKILKIQYEKFKI